MSRYLVTGFNSETGEIFRGEEIDQAGAEHQASSWVSEQPIGSHAEVLQIGPSHQPGWPEIKHSALCKRVLGGVVWGDDHGS